MARWLVEKTYYAATLIGFKVGGVAVRILPRRWLFAFSNGLANLAYLLIRGYRTRSIMNLRVALAGRAGACERRAIVRRTLRNFFRACVEMIIAMESSDEERRAAVSVDGLEHLEAAIAEGKGVIILSAHLGNFFLVGTRLAVAGYPVHMLINQPSNSKFAKLLDEFRRQIKIRTIHARPRQQALRNLNSVLRSNGIAIMIADEYRKGNGIPTTLFGRTVFARRGPATIAARTGAAVVPACLVRQGDDSLRLLIEPELELARPGSRQREAAENVAIMTRWLEKTVRAYPDQWNWQNIRWWADSAKTGDRESEVTNRRSEIGIRGPSANV
jgi:KDO2-lipid IV(A) lauroyltransferase